MDKNRKVIYRHNPIGNEGDIKAFIYRYGKEIARFTIFPTAEDFIRLGMEITKAENNERDS